MVFSYGFYTSNIFISLFGSLLHLLPVSRLVSEMCMYGISHLLEIVQPRL
jgi:hypothetical protein